MGADFNRKPKARELFIESLEITDNKERERFLREKCGDDLELFDQVDELLRMQSKVGDFLETPAVTDARRTDAHVDANSVTSIAAVTEKPGDRIGAYKLLQKIGEGGCGLVYMAEQERPVRRKVAFKIIKLGMDTRSVIARFEAERQALAMMDHPNIAKVYDAGSTETGRPYFVMELVRGIRITEYCDQNQVTTENRLALFVQVCQAIQHAHQKGVIHRDIKPSNILITLHDGQPVPKVIDFGIAKATEHRLTDKTFFTEFSTFIGTPAYMSPEQAEMSGLDIDTRSDIYSLGVLLYELLTGKTPFDAEMLLKSGLDECRRTLREKEPVRPSTRLSTMLDKDLTSTASQRRIDAPKLIHLLRGDLDWIVMKCLEKDRTRRYETANELAADLRRYLHNDPVLARPPSNLYRLHKLYTRNKGAFSAAAAIVGALMIGIVASALQAIRAIEAEEQALMLQKQESQMRREAEQQREKARLEKAQAHLNEYVADINLAQQSLTEGNLGRAVQLINKHYPKSGETELRGFEWRYLWRKCLGNDHSELPTQPTSVQALAFSPDGNYLAVGLYQKINIYDLRNRTLTASMPRGVISMFFLPDGKTFITGNNAGVRIWRTDDWSEVQMLTGAAGPMSMTVDGSLLATEYIGDFSDLKRRDACIWDTKRWQIVHRLPAVSGPFEFSPDGRKIAFSKPGGIVIRDLSNASNDKQLENSTNIVMHPSPKFNPQYPLKYTPDGKCIIAARNLLSEKGVFNLGIWNVDSGKEIGAIPDLPELVEHTGLISGMSFSPDGRVLATSSWDHSIRLWDFTKRKKIAVLQGHLNEVWSLATSSDGKWVASGSKDGEVKLWETRRREDQNSIFGAWFPITFSQDSRKLAAVNFQGRVAFINLATMEFEEQFPINVFPFRFISFVALSADLKRMVHILEGGRIAVLDTEVSESLVLNVPYRRPESVALSPDGNELIVGGRDQPLIWWNLRTGTNALLTIDGQRAVFSPDGLQVAILNRAANIQVWNVSLHQMRTNFSVGSGMVFNMVFSPNGKILATTSGPEDFEHSIRFWDTSSGKLIGSCTGHKQSVWSVAFSPDGKTLATGSDDSTLKLWNVATRQELLTVRRLGATHNGLLFSPDGQFLVGAITAFPANNMLHFYTAPLLSDISTNRIQ